MTPQEWNRYVDCVDCLEVINSVMDPVYRIAGNQCLCLECGIRRGGSYDRSIDVWVRLPSVAAPGAKPNAAG